MNTTEELIINGRKIEKLINLFCFMLSLFNLYAAVMMITYLAAALSSPVNATSLTHAVSSGVFAVVVLILSLVYKGMRKSKEKFRSQIELMQEKNETPD